MTDKPRSRFPLTESVPDHLRIYLSHQDYSLYTAIDQASWRFIMKVGADFYGKQGHAHEKYLNGLRDTGIPIERLPRISEMDEKLRRFNWRAIPVIGFIPPAAFLEFQSYGLLPIACDMRKLENINYTPAPDIVHEAAGHAPILADQAFADYLRGYGDVARKAIFSKENMNVYYAVRHLSDTKERPDATAEEVAEAQANLDQRLSEVSYDSEVDWVTRLGWWTAEYGLVGSLEDPKIYGAGLLSSIGEGYQCLTDKVKKIALSVDCVHTNFDITNMQPQLFVTPDFERLNTVLEDLANMMSFRRGGIFGLETAKKGATLTTTELDSGLQISGVLETFTAEGDEVVFLKYSGPVQLAYKDVQLAGHDPGYHHHGYSSPVGRIKGKGMSAAWLSTDDLEAMGFTAGSKGRMEFESGVVVEGVLTKRLKKDARNQVMTFTDCSVTRGDKVLYQPDWGPFDMACGHRVVSVFGGAADRYAYLLDTEGVQYDPGVHKSNRTAANEGLIPLYNAVRGIREGSDVKGKLDELTAVHDTLEGSYPADWLLRWELLELNQQHELNAPWADAVLDKLRMLATKSDEYNELIGRGFRLLDIELEPATA